MYQPVKRGRQRAANLVQSSGYGAMPGFAAGGHADYAEDKKLVEKAFAQHDQQLHGGKRTRLKLKTGGIADGGMANDRLDQRPRGGEKKNGTTINIAIVAPKKDESPDQDSMKPPPIMAPPPPPPPGPPGGGPGGPPPPPGGPGGGMGGMPVPPGGMGMPGGMQPRPMIKTGGRPRRQFGGPTGVMPMNPAAGPAAMPPQAAPWMAQHPMNDKMINDPRRAGQYFQRAMPGGATWQTGSPGNFAASPYLTRPVAPGRFGGGGNFYGYNPLGANAPVAPAPTPAATPPAPLPTPAAVPPVPNPGMKRGGRAMTAGAGSGAGRAQKRDRFKTAS